MKILHWIDSDGNERHGEPINDRACDAHVGDLNTKYHGEIHHWAEAVHETDEEQ